MEQNTSSGKGFAVASLVTGILSIIFLAFIIVSIALAICSIVFARIAKKKGEALKKKASELVELAKQKGTPVLEKAADDVRQRAVLVTKDVLRKLEGTETK